jgi:hypothetical protein
VGLWEKMLWVVIRFFRGRVRGGLCLLRGFCRRFFGGWLVLDPWSHVDYCSGGGLAEDY